MKKITIELKQHTPMLHFDKTSGATLRATEVKPKLDRFLIKNLFHGSVPEEFLIKDTNALDYQMRITSSVGLPSEYSSKKNNCKEKKPPMYFGETDSHKENPKYKSFSKALITIKVLIKSGGLSDEINKNKETFIKFLYAFFFETNFGTRQTKGYGGFFPDAIKIDGKKATFNLQEIATFVCDYKSKENKHNIYHFSLTADSNNVMEKIQWFYQSLRQGINMFGVYMKPMIFQYVHSKNKEIVWEKKAIKERFYSGKEHNISKARAIKPVFGLSTVELWGCVGKIWKLEGKQWKTVDDEHKKYNFNTVKLSNEKFPRVPSPLTFKVFFESKNKYEVYIIMNDELVAEMGGKVLGKDLAIKAIKAVNSKTEQSFGTMNVKIIEEFNWCDFWSFVREANIDDLLYRGGSDDRGDKIYKTLKGIYKGISIVDNKQNFKR